MDLSIVAAIGIGKGIETVRALNPAAYAGFKAVVGVAAEVLTRLDTVLADDKVSADEINSILDEAQNTGAGRLVVGLVSGALSSALTKFK